MRKLLPYLLCLAIFHSPDGKEFRIDSKHIVAIKPAENVKGHVAEGVNTIIYTAGQNFGVTESVVDIIVIVADCVED